MAKRDLQARPIYPRKRDSIEAHLTIVFAALAVSRWIEAQTGWSIRKFVRTARRYRTIQIQAGPRTIAAADPLPADLRQALEASTRPARAPVDLRTNLAEVRYDKGASRASAALETTLTAVSRGSIMMVGVAVPEGWHPDNV